MGQTFLLSHHVGTMYLAAMWRSAFSVFGITDRDLRSIIANVNMQHYGYQGITTNAGGKTIKSQNPEKNKTDPVLSFCTM